jgi:predicted transcriptional regulator
VPSDMTLARFMSEIVARYRHTVFPVCEGRKPIGILSVNELGGVPAGQWETATVGAYADRDAARVESDCDLMEALRMMTGEHEHHMLMVTSRDGALEGILTKTDILRAFGNSEQRKPRALNHVVT